MIITLSHCRNLNYCSEGIRLFFKIHKLDFMDFVRNGIDEKILLDTNDSMAKQVVEEAKNGR